MLTWENDVELTALHKRGWTITAIAKHTGFDRKTVRKYLAGDGTPGVRARPGPDPFEPFLDYVTARLVEDPHLWARTLYDELEELGFGLSYQSLTRNIRQRNRVSPLGWWGFGPEVDRVRAVPGVSLRASGWAIA